MQHAIAGAHLRLGGVFFVALVMCCTCISIIALISYQFPSINSLALLSIFVVGLLAMYTLGNSRSILIYLPVYNLVSMALAFPIGGIIVSLGLSSESAALINGSRPILLFLLMGYLLLCRVILSAPGLVPILLLCMILLVGFLKSDGDYQSRAAYLMNSFSSFFFVLCYSEYLVSKKTILNYCSVSLLKFFFLFLIFSTIFNVLLIFSFYDLFRPDLYFSYRDRSVDGVQYGEFPGSWTSSVGSFSFYRMTGSFSDPIQWGYFCAVTSLATYFSFLKSNSKLQYICLLFFSVLLLFLSGSKGSWLLFLGTILIYHSRIKNAVIGTIAMIFYVVAVFVVSSLSGTSGVIHLAGLIGGTTSILNAGPIDMIFGYGMGSGGNLATSVGADVEEYKKTWLMNGSESGFGVLIYQLGLFGVFVFVYFLKRLRNALKSNKEANLSKSVYIDSFVISYFTLFFLQENLLNSAFLFVFFSLIVFVINFDKEKNENIFH